MGQIRKPKCVGLYDFACSFVDGGTIVDVGCGDGTGMERILKAHPGSHVVGIEESAVSRKLGTIERVHRMNTEGSMATLVDMRLSKDVGRVGDLLDGNTYISLAVMDYVVNDVQYWEQLVIGISRLVAKNYGTVIISVPYKPMYPTVKDCGRYTLEYSTFNHILKHWFSSVVMHFARRNGGQFRIITESYWWRNSVIYICR